MKNIYLLLIGFFFLASCGGLSEAGKVLRNEKVKTTDEFLVKKRNPLVLPPNFEEIPEPGKKIEKKEEEKQKIQKILQAPEINNQLKNKPSSTEESILNRISK
jgi:hypothetical protein|tara:strand:+ start:108 stop:416 length:309 start_codon:yes stop_codon:yes gene_type:complete